MLALIVEILMKLSRWEFVTLFNFFDRIYMINMIKWQSHKIL
jgi:hypothetical protein